MFYVAFTLGLFGSLHCLGMCGPLAFSLMPGISERSSKSIVRALGYNTGRVLSYVSLGLVMGVFGGLVNFSGLQKPLTIGVGVFLILLFFLSLDLEKLLFKSGTYRGMFEKYNQFLSKNLRSLSQKGSLFLGVLNGFIPCGLVYLALAGALTTGGLLKGGLFMFYFGLGTFPAMFLLLSSFSLMDLKRRLGFRKVFAFLQLFVGVFLIYKAFLVEIPLDLSLISSMINPIMCH